MRGEGAGAGRGGQKPLSGSVIGHVRFLYIFFGPLDCVHPCGSGKSAINGVYRKCAVSWLTTFPISLNFNSRGHPCNNFAGISPLTPQCQGTSPKASHGYSLRATGFPPLPFQKTIVRSGQRRRIESGCGPISTKDRSGQEEDKKRKRIEA